MQHLFANRKKLIVGIIVGVMVIVIFVWRYIAVNKACPPAQVEQYSLGDTVLHNGVEYTLTDYKVLSQDEFCDEYEIDPIHVKASGQESKMVLYRIAGKEEHITAKELHLDNPPMRTDIWQDLTERPSGIHAQAYEEFQKIVQEITEFEAPKGERHAQLQKVIDTAIEVRQKILRGESIGAIRAATVPTEEALRSSGDIELKEKFDAWNGKFNEKSEDESYKIKDVAELAKDDALKEMEDKLVQECHYLMLCEDVRLQEEFIQKRIERYWDGQRLTRLLKRMLNYRALAVLSGSVLIAMSFLGIISLDEAVPTLQKLGFVIAPVIVDVVVNLFGVHKPDQKG